jgi:hypothetical protein
MKRFAALLAGAGAALALAGAVGAGLVVGVAEDATKYAPDGGTGLYEALKADGLTSNRVSVFWNFQDPTTIPEKDFLDRVVPAAGEAGVQLVFALYADPRIKGSARSIGRDPDGFCSYAAQVARTYPTVTKIIIGNEPNQPRFWQPQFDSHGHAVAAARFEPVLAKCYDALKSVNPNIDVIGVGLSPRGNDNPSAINNVSRSPVRFLHDLGDAYRASGRKLPLMDEFAFHCYPNVNTDSVSKGYPWPDVGCVNLGRLKQALWDAFDRTGQPTPPEEVPVRRSADNTVKALSLVIDETGWQVAVDSRKGYNGWENVPTISDSTQARYYAQLVRIAECDPGITAFHFLYFLDSPQLADFQSGMEDVDGNARGSAGTVRNAIAEGCTTGQVFWQHTSTVTEARASRRLLGGRRPAIALRAGEAFSYTITFGGTRTVAGSGSPNLELDVSVPEGFADRSATVTMRAWANPGRTKTFVIRP